jgi:hypothetical protein
LEEGEILPEHRKLITQIRAHAVKAVGAFKNPALNFMISFALRRAELVRALDRGQANQNFLRDYMNPVLDTNKEHSKFSYRTATSVYQILQKELNPNEIEHITKLGAFVEGFHTILEYTARSADNIRRVTFAKLREADHYEVSDNGDKRYHQKPSVMTNKLQNIRDTSLLENYEIQQTKDWFKAVSQKGSYHEMINNIYTWSKGILKHTKVSAIDKNGNKIEFFSFPTAALGNCGFYTNSLETRCHEMGNIRILNLFKGNLKYIKDNKAFIFQKVKQFIDNIKDDQYARSAHSSKRDWKSFEELVTKEGFLSGLMGENWKTSDYTGNLIDKLTDSNLNEILVAKKNDSYDASDWYAYAEEKELVLSWLLDFIPVAWHVTDKAAYNVESFGLPVKSPDSPQKHLYASGGAIHDMKMSKADPENIIDIVYGLRVALDDQGANILNKTGHTVPFNSWFQK